MGSSKGISIAALVCGIIGIVGLFVTAHPVLAIIVFVIAVLGIVFGGIGMSRAKKNGESSGLAIAGLVCGIIGTALALIGVMCALCVIGSLAAAAKSLQ